MNTTTVKIVLKSFNINKKIKKQKSKKISSNANNKNTRESGSFGREAGYAYPRRLR
ncbi:MAG: hypothetical protein J6M62_11165 [Selenomonadaceae bacterium]|nr:hypothetical protein [Selenomonadaceae bacterium]